MEQIFECYNCDVTYPPFADLNEHLQGENDETAYCFFGKTMVEGGEEETGSYG